MYSKGYDQTSLELDIQNIKTHINGCQTKLKKYNSAISEFNANKKQKQQHISFFKENCKCPTCSQPIEEKIKKEKILTTNYEISNIDDDIERVNVAIKENTETIELFELNLEKVIESLSFIKGVNREVELLEKEIKRIEASTQKSVIKNNIVEEKEKLKSLEGGLLALEEERNLHSEDLMYHELAGELLRDGGVKSKIIKYYLPHMNKYINKFLSSMDFFVQFQLDDEFNEQIKSRYRDDFSYMNFSEGEKMRIDLALLLAWREIARLKNSVNCNLLILDEVFDSSLDSVGMDELMKLLRIISDKANVYVISHKSDQLVDKFSNIVSFEKKNNFSKIIYN
jgi:hypothetical protein